MKRPDTVWETTLYYAWIHLPTGKEGSRSITLPYPRTIAIKELDKLINKWNGQDLWLYKRITKF